MLINLDMKQFFLLFCFASKNVFDDVDAGFHDANPGYLYIFCIQYCAKIKPLNCHWSYIKPRT